jgi:hypothetical protein
MGTQAPTLPYREQLLQPNWQRTGRPAGDG